MAAASRAWEQAADVDFIYVPGSDSTCTWADEDTMFAVVPYTGGGAVAFSPFHSVAQRQLYIDYPSIDSGVFPDEVTTVGVLRHELGHILGLAHEHYRLDVLPAGCGDDLYYEPLGRYDRRSVMHYPQCDGDLESDLGLTLADRQAVRVFYGAPSVQHEPGRRVDIDGDAVDDIVLVGGNDYGGVGLGRSTGSAFTVLFPSTGAVGGEATEPGALAFARDFDGDGVTDLALAGTATASGIPVALSSGGGIFAGYDEALSAWAELAVLPGAEIVSGDFNGDGRSDFVVTGPMQHQFGLCGSKPFHYWCSQRTIARATSDGDGSFTFSEVAVDAFARKVTDVGARLLPGDFDGDGRSDLIVVGGVDHSTLSTAFSNGSGGWTVRTTTPGSFTDWASRHDAVVLSGDFDGDGRTDVALTGPSTWSTLPVAMSNGNGSFAVVNGSVGAFAEWSSRFGARHLLGDFDGDGCTDVALTGPTTWSTLPVALSDCDGTFTVVNGHVGAYADWAETGAEPIVGDFDGDGDSDVALTGPETFGSIPVAFSDGDGTFTVSNINTAELPQFASRGGIQTLQ